MYCVCVYVSICIWGLVLYVRLVLHTQGMCLVCEFLLVYVCESVCVRVYM